MPSRLLAAFAVPAVVLAALSAAPASGTTVAPSRGEVTDIVLMPDSTDMSDGQWSLVQRSYLRMLSNEDALPRDGSVALGIVQYASDGDGGQEARVLLPLTVVDERSAGEIAAVIADSSPMSAYEPGASATSMAVEELLANGRKGASRTVCATAASPWTAEQAAASARDLAAAEVSHASMVALDSYQRGPAWVSETFSPFAQGSGAVVSARSPVQVASLMDWSCLLKEVHLEAIEVNQVIQNWENDIPLAEGKATVVRVFLESGLPWVTAASGVLHGTQDGAPLPGSPLSPANAGGAVAVDSDVANAADRADLDSSLNFSLPASWLSGDVELRFEATSKLSCSSAPAAAQDCAVDVSFLPTVEPEISYVAVPYKSGSSTVQPSSSEMSEQALRSEDLLPVANVKDSYVSIPSVGTGLPDLETVNDKLYFQWLLTAMVKSPFSWWTDQSTWYGAVTGNGGGLAYGIPAKVSSGFLDGKGATHAYGYARNRGPHEQAHAFGAHHVTNEVVNGTKTVGSTTYAKGWCGEASALTAPDYPYVTTLGGVSYPTLSALNVTDKEVWGLAPRYLSSNEDLAVVDPYKVFPLMSYCNALDTTSHYRWMDVQTYDVLTREFLSTAVTVSSAPQAPPASSLEAGVVVRGLVQVPPSGLPSPLAAAPAVSFLPAVPAATVSYPREGDWQAVFRDAKGKPLATRVFALPEAHGDPAQPGGMDVTESKVPFAVVVPAAVAQRTSVLSVYRPGDNGRGELAGSLRRSGKDLSVRVLSARMLQSGVSVSWKVEGADIKRMPVSVFYRPSGEEPWMPVALDVPGSSVVIPLQALPGGGRGQFAVSASDGLSVARGLSRAVAVEDNSPVLTMDREVPDQAVGAQNVTFKASAHDVEDGDLTSQVVWLLDGEEVAFGAGFALFADEWDEGRHEVTALVTDSAGQEAQRTVSVAIAYVDDGLAP